MIRLRKHMSHLRSVDKGTFLRILREGITSPMKANFTPKITKIQELPGASPPWSPPGHCPGPIGGLKVTPNPMPLTKNPRPPLNRIPGSAPGVYCDVICISKTLNVGFMYIRLKDVLHHNAV